MAARAARNRRVIHSDEVALRFPSLGGAPAEPKADVPRPAVPSVLHDLCTAKSEGTEMIEAQNLTKRYGDKTAVDDLTFHREAGARHRLSRAQRLG